MIAESLALVAFGMARRRRKTPEEALQNPVRRTLFGRIVLEPGLRLKELFDPKTEPRGTIHYHLSILERVGALTSRFEAGARRYYPADMNPRDLRQRNLLLRGRMLEFVREVAAHPGIGQDQLVRTRKISRKVLRDYVPRLLEEGLLRVEPGTKTKYYHPTEDLHRILRKIDTPPAPAADTREGSS